MENLEIRLIRNKKEMEDVLEVRRVVFIAGQKVPEKRERDGLDETAKHVLVLYNSQPVGCARVRFIEGNAKLERIAILEKYRGLGLGKKLMDFLIEYCEKEGCQKIVMHSQYYIKNFYKKCGFEQKGKIFMDAGIEHIEMQKMLEC